jgi:uncharacterized membrane protein
MTALFEFLFKYRPIMFQKGAVAFRPILPIVWLGVLAVAAAVIAYLLYRRTGGAVPRTWRFSLVVLRTVPLLILLAIMLQPVLVLHSVVPQKSFVAVAYDLSKSMEIRDGEEGQSRLEEERQLLRPEGNSFLNELGKKFKLRFFRFSNGAERVESFQDLPRHGNLTDLARSLDQIAGEMGNAPVSGIVLVTDGADNHSSDLPATAEQLRARKIPVYPVAIGSASIRRDTEVLRVTIPKKVLKDALIEADVAVSSRGYAGRRTRLVVKQAERTLQSQEITLGGDDEVKTHKVTFSCEGAGPKILTFRIEPFRDELVPENNDQDALVRVEDVQPKILYVEGEPRWIYGFVRRAVAEDKNLSLITLLRQAEGKLYRQGVESEAVLKKGFPVDKAELYPFKALILGSIEASFFTFDQLRLISDFVSERGGSFLMLGGRNSFGQGGYINTPLEDVLPVSLRSSGRDSVPPLDREMEFKAQLTGYGLTNPITRLSPNEQENKKRWDSAAPLVGYNPTAGAKAGATVLASVDLGARGGGDPVLLAFQRFGRGKSVALTTDGVWRWRMEQDSRDNFHELFWKQLLRWMVSDVPDSINVESEKHSYSLDESVVLRAEAHDDSFVSLNDAQVTANIKSPSGQITSVPLLWELRKEGVYAARFKPEEQGVYDVTADFYRGDKKIGSAKANFRIAESFEEFHNAALNSDLLDRLAATTGGRRYSPRDLHNLPEDISYVDSGSFRVEEKDLWDMPLVYLLLVGSMAAEWILRKRKGLA